MALNLGNITLAEQLLVSYGIGTAAGPAIEPFAQTLTNDAWKLNQVVPPNAYILAEGVAQGQVARGDAVAWAAEQGIGGSQFDALVAIANVGPGSAYAFELWRRGHIGEDGFRRAMKRLGLEQEWIEDLVKIKQTLLTAEQLAVMIQRNVVDGGNILPNQPPTGNADVPPMPQVPIDPVTEAAGMGIDLDRLSAMARIIGLPASPDLAARLHFRGIINEDSFNLAIKEGNTRGEWAPFLLKGFREIPTAEQFVEAHLRGWIKKQEMYDGTARHGMTPADTDLEFQIHRRPLTPHAIKQALARGANFNPEAGELTDPYAASVHQASLGPEWYEMAVALQGSYPSLFITNRLVTSGIITPDEGKAWLQKSGMADEVVTALHTSWTAGGGTATGGEVAKAQTQLWTTTHTAYKNAEIDQAEAQANFALLGINAADQQSVLQLWNAERDTFRKQLTPTQLKKAWHGAALNPATGVAWTRDDALNALLARGYSPNDANTFLEL